MTCIYKFVRGARKGELCSKKLASNSDKCTTHSKITKIPKTIDTCLCGNPLSDNKADTILSHAHLCDTCAQHTDIVTCKQCKNVGRLAFVQAHFRKQHIVATNVIGTDMSITDFLALDKHIVQQPVVGTCTLCDFSSCEKNEMIQHIMDNHMTEKPSTIINNNTIACPIHILDYIVGRFCRKCMTRSENGNGWDCALCSGTHISPPMEHFLSQHGYINKTAYHGCCGNEFQSIREWTRHFLNKHVNFTMCPLPGCHSMLNYDVSIGEHLTCSHKIVYTYKNNTSENFLELVKYRTEHIHNAIATASTSVDKIPVIYNVQQLKTSVDLNKLALWVAKLKWNLPPPIVWPEKYWIKTCTTLFRDAVVEYYNSIIENIPCRYSYSRLPQELWEIIYARLNYSNRINLSMTSDYLSYIHKESPMGKLDDMITWVLSSRHLFRFSPCGYMCASRARSTFLLTDDELHQLPVTLADNPYYKCAPFMRLYEAEDLGKGIYTKFGTPEKFMVAYERRQERSRLRKK